VPSNLVVAIFLWCTDPYVYMMLMHIFVTDVESGSGKFRV
jgi:hypothetical protein